MMKKEFLRKLSLLFSLTFAVLSIAHAQAPAGYYNSAKGKKGEALKSALFSIIDDHNIRSYDQLWDDFKKTDVRPDGKIWDMYSDITNYRPGADQGASASGENIGGYNREHSMPKSWFKEGKPMYSDLFHLVPTDVYVNNRRSNFPFGETNGEIWSSHNKFSKVGACTVSGYSGTVFEPNDEYKGDFARIYFYMATRYEDRIASWSSPMLSGNSYTAFAPWALKMLLRWAAEDPVSPKEIDRNNAIFGLQHNRNPFVDFPGLEQYVWGNKTTVAFNPDDYEGGTGGDGGETNPPVEVAAPIFNPAPGIVAKGTQVTLSTSTEGATIYYTINSGDLQTAYMSATLTIDAPTSITAYAQRGVDVSETVNAIYTLPSTAPEGTTTYVLITEPSELKAGQHYLIGAKYKAEYVAMSSAGSSNIRTYQTVELTGNNTQITTDTNDEGLPVSFLLGGTTDSWTLYDEAGGTYLGLGSNDNKLPSYPAEEGEKTRWSISVADDGYAAIRNNQYTGRTIRFNPSSPRFATYTSGQTPVSLYVSLKETGIDLLTRDNAGLVNVVDTKGRLIRHAVKPEEAVNGLPTGIYIVGGRQVLVK